jgi:hypothetical protein
MSQDDRAKRFEDVVDHFNKWAPSTVEGARTTLASITRWALSRGWDPWELSPGQVASYIRDKEANAVANAKRRQDKSPAASPSAPVAKVHKRHNDGSTVARTAMNSLSWLVHRAGCPWDVHAPVFARIAPPRVDGTPSGSFTLGIVLRLEMALLDSSGYNPRVKGQVAGLLAMARACLRLEQANQTRFVREEAGCAIGVTYRQKSPTYAQQVPRTCLAPLAPLIDGVSWYESLKRALEGVEVNGQFIMRDTNGPSGDPFESSEWANVPLQGARFAIAQRKILQHVCGLSWDETGSFGNSSARHWAPEVALARSVPAEQRVEIGQWSRSSLQDRDMAPHELRAEEARRVAAVLPDRYARQSKLLRAARIMTDQIHASRAVLSDRGVDAIPVLGGWEIFHDSRWKHREQDT